MKTYLYRYRRANNDRDGNPRHWVHVYRVKNNVPFPLHEDEVPIGYHDPENIVCKIITEEENLKFSSQEEEVMQPARIYNNRTRATSQGGITMTPADWRQRQKKIQIIRF